MEFIKEEILDTEEILSGWCTCANCGKDGNEPLSSEYNVRSGPKNPQQNS